MSQSSAALVAPKPRSGPVFHWWRVAIPVLLTLALATLPPPHGLPQHAWYYTQLTREPENLRDR